MNNQDRLIIEKEQLNDLVNSCQEEIRRLKEEYIMLQNASEEYEDKLLKENQRLNNILNELEKWLCFGLEEPCYVQGDMFWHNACEQVLNKLKELKESDK